MQQHTLKKEISIYGIGLHSGREVTIKLKPADADSGIIFVRTDLPGSPRVKADLSNVSSTARGTSIGHVNTVEHVLSALYALSVTNAVIELNSVEPPVLDGSSAGYCELIKKAGIRSQSSVTREIKPDTAIFATEGDKSIVAVPYDRLKISFMINYPFDFIGTQFFRFDMDRKNYEKEIAPARTYGFVSEVEALRKQGLAKGAGFENAVVIADDRYLSQLRFKDELVRHKILDLIGDISLIGAQIKAHIICIRSGHSLNIKMAKLLKEVG